jgi:formylglycine-generating enzyme required for sulfatase activity
LEVGGGTFYRTYTNWGNGPINEADPATVSDFRLDEYLVTVGRFRQFVNAWFPHPEYAGWVPAPGSGKHTHLNGAMGLVDVSPGATSGTGFETGWLAAYDSLASPTNANLACDAYATWTTSPGSNETLPINCANWYEAYAFCIWDGGFLPSLAELQYAAAGGSQQRQYPWGSADPGQGVEYAIFGDGVGTCNYPTLSACTGVANIAPVGTATLGAGLWGQLDLAGEVNEFTLDWNLPYVDPCTDCACLEDPPLPPPPGIAGLGGSFRDMYEALMPSRQYTPQIYPANRDHTFGLRCARTP